MIHNLDIFKGVAGRVVLCGQERDVRDLTAEDLLAVQAAESLDEQVRFLASLIEPPLSAEQSKGLTPAQIKAVIQIALDAVEKLPDRFPNADGPSPMISASSSVPA